MDIEEIVTLSVKHNASDLHLSARQPLRWRIGGTLSPFPYASPEAAEIIDTWLTIQQKEKLTEKGQVDFALSTNSGIRLRGHAFSQQQGYALALRLLPARCPAMADLGMPTGVQPLLHQTDGLILIAGATGSGKSTSLAAIVGELNLLRESHILLLEEPVEYIHHSGRSLIQQREVGLHCKSLVSGLKAALRQDPDIIVLGEIRDRQAMRLALAAAQTGHLVLATIHAACAAGALERVVSLFAAQEKGRISCQLASALRAVLAQKLVPGRCAERVALYELLLNTPAVSNILREGKTWQLPGMLQTGLRQGMQSFEHSRHLLLATGALAGTDSPAESPV